MTEPILSRNFDRPDARTLAGYRATGGYEALRTALAAGPASVAAEVKKANLRGLGGAGFPTATKWGFIPAQRTGPVYLVVNADEGEPGTFKDRYILERDPHALIEGMLLAAFAIGCHTSFIYIRGEYVQPWRRFSRGAPGGGGRRPRRAERRGQRIRAPDRRAPGGGRLHLRRGDGAHLLARGPEGVAEGQAPVPRDQGRVRPADRREQRRDPGGDPADRHARRRVVRRARVEDAGRDAALLRVGPRRAPGRLRGLRRDHPPPARRARGRRAPGAAAEGRGPRRVVGAAPHGRRDRRHDGRRRPPERGHDGRLRGRHRDGRHDLHPRGAPRRRALLRPRVLRPVHALPGVHRVDLQDHRPHPRRQGRPAGSRHHRRRRQARHGQHDLRVLRRGHRAVHLVRREVPAGVRPPHPPRRLRRAARPRRRARWRTEPDAEADGRRQGGRGSGRDEPHRDRAPARDRGAPLLLPPGAPDRRGVPALHGRHREDAPADDRVQHARRGRAWRS